MSFQIQHGLFKFELIDHYAILGIPLDADPKQIRQRYLKIASRLHPDTCKAENDAEKKQASQILSKLVNPAYEQLLKDKSRAEYQLVLSQIGKRLSGEKEKIAIASQPAKELFQASINLDGVYHKLLQSLASEQYQSLEQVVNKIAQISELNLVYLILTQGQGIQEKSKQPIRTGRGEKTSGKADGQTTVESNSQKTEEQTNKSPVASYLRRAQEYFDKNNFAKAILELRDALKIDPNNSKSHGLMGLAYLKQNQIAMAKVHINKAWEANPKDPIAVKGKEELDKLTSQKSKAKPHSSSSKEKSSGKSEKTFLGMKLW